MATLKMNVTLTNRIRADQRSCPGAFATGRSERGRPNGSMLSLEVFLLQKEMCIPRPSRLFKIPGKTVNIQTDPKNLGDKTNCYDSWYLEGRSLKFGTPARPWMIMITMPGSGGRGLSRKQQFHSSIQKDRKLCHLWTWIWQTSV